MTGGDTLQVLALGGIVLHLLLGWIVLSDVLGYKALDALRETMNDPARPADAVDEFLAGIAYVLAVVVWPVSAYRWRRTGRVLGPAPDRDGPCP